MQPIVNETDRVSVSADDMPALLQQECLTWQKRLRLQDWNIETRMVRLHEMPGKDSVAAIRIYTDRRDAIMYLLSPVDVPLIADVFIGTEASNYSLSIVHELLHIYTDQLADSSDPLKAIAEEQLVNALSRIIVKAYAGTALEEPAPVPSVEHGHYL